VIRIERKTQVMERAPHAVFRTEWYCNTRFVRGLEDVLSFSLKANMNNPDILQNLGISEKISNQEKNIHWSFELLRPAKVETLVEKNAQEILLAIIGDETMTSAFPKHIDNPPDEKYYQTIRTRYAPELSIEDVKVALSTTDYRNLFENFADISFPNEDIVDLHHLYFVNILRKEKKFKKIDEKIIPSLLEELEKIFGRKLNNPLRIRYNGKSFVPRSHQLTSYGDETYHDLGLAERYNSPLHEATELEDSEANINALIGRLQLIVHELTHAFVDELLGMGPGEKYDRDGITALRAFGEGFTTLAQTVLLLRLIERTNTLEDKRYVILLQKNLTLLQRGFRRVFQGNLERYNVYSSGYKIASKLRKMPIESVINLIKSVDRNKLQAIEMGSVEFEEFVADPVNFLSRL